MKKFVLIGNYGVGNFGDEAMLEYFTQRYGTVVQWQVLSAHPKHGQNPRLPFGVRSFFTPWHKTILAFMRADGVVFGGGTLFTDIESVKACMLWGLHAMFAIIFRKKLYLAFQGIGPFKSSLGYRITRFVCSKATYISVRDSASYKRVQQMNLSTSVSQTFDPVLSLIPDTEHSSTESGNLVLIPRHNSGEDFIAAVQSELKKQSYTQIVIASFQPNSQKEQSYIAFIKQRISVSNVVSITSIHQAIEVIKNANVVISHRFHATIIAKALHVPVVSVHQHKDDKHSLLNIDMQNLTLCRDTVKLAEDELMNCLLLEKN